MRERERYQESRMETLWGIAREVPWERQKDRDKERGWEKGRH